MILYLRCSNLLKFGVFSFFFVFRLLYKNQIRDNLKQSHRFIWCATVVFSYCNMTPSTEIDQLVSVLSTTTLNSEKLVNYDKYLVQIKNCRSTIRSDVKTVLDLLVCDLKSAAKQIAKHQSEIASLKSRMNSSALDISILNSSTYASKTSESITPKSTQPEKFYDTLIVEGKDSQLDINQLKTSLKPLRKNASFKFSHNKSTNKLFIDVKSNNDVIKSVTDNLNKIKNVKISNKSKTTTKLIIKGVESDLSSSDIMLDLFELNDIVCDKSKSELKVLFEMKRNKDSFFKNIVIIASDDLLLELLSLKSVKLGYKFCKVEPFIRVNVCGHCTRYNHKAYKDNLLVCNGECKCNFCAEPHKSSECPNRLDPTKFKCSNCSKAGILNVNHKATDTRSCPILRKAIKSNIKSQHLLINQHNDLINKLLNQ